MTFAEYVGKSLAPNPALRGRYGTLRFLLWRTVGAFLISAAISFLRLLVWGFTRERVWAYLAIDVAVALFALIGTVVALRHYRTASKAD